MAVGKLQVLLTISEGCQFLAMSRSLHKAAYNMAGGFSQREIDRYVQGWGEKSPKRKPQSHL